MKPTQSGIESDRPITPQRGRRLRLVIAALATLVACTLSGALRAQAEYSAAFVSQTTPNFVALLSPAPVVVTMQNTGTATWYQADGDVFLATQEPQDNYYWCIQGNPYGSHSGNRVLLPYDVAPNQQVTFNFTVMPLGCRFSGPSPLRFRMLSQLHGTFGDETPDPQVVVSTATEFVGQQVPATVPAGAVVLVTETFKHTTPMTLQTTDGYALRRRARGQHDMECEPRRVADIGGAGRKRDLHLHITVPATVGTTISVAGERSRRLAFGGVSPANRRAGHRGWPPNYEGLCGTRQRDQSGWGINFAHQGNTIFATWFTLRSYRQGIVAVMTAHDRRRRLYGAVPDVGPPFNSVPFDPTQVVGIVVGTGTLTFTDLNTERSRTRSTALRRPSRSPARYSVSRRRARSAS